MAEWQNIQIWESETRHFCNSIVLSPQILQSILAKEVSSVEKIFPAVRDAEISNIVLLHKEKKSEDLQPAAEEGDKSASILLKHLFAWDQEAVMWKTVGDVN